MRRRKRRRTEEEEDLGGGGGGEKGEGGGGGGEKEEEEASKCYFRNSFCPFLRRRMRMGRRRTEKVLYMRGLRKRMSRRTEEEEVEEDCEEKD